MSLDKEKNLYKAFEQLMAISLNQISMDGLESLVHPEVMGWGTTIDEEVYGLNNYIALIRTQEETALEQGLNFTFDREKVYEHYSHQDDTALFVEKIKATIEMGDIVNTFTFRYSALMGYQNEQWKLLHWHGSTPSDIENDTWHVNEWKAEKEKLEKLVAEQTANLQLKNQELEIEASSERVRANAMGMQKPDDIMNVLNVIKEEVDKFELGNIGTWIWIINEDNTLTQWDISETSLDGSLNNINITLDLEKSESMKPHIPKWDNTDYYSMLWEGNAYQTLIDEIKEIDPESGKTVQKMLDTGVMTTYWQACAPFSNGVIGLDYDVKPSESIRPVLIKMADAFGMAYQRFEDLQQAEQQAREARVEVALERVRSRSIGMQKGDELVDVVRLLNKEIVELGIEIDGTLIATDFGNLKDGFNDWFAREGQNFLEKFHVPYIDHPITEKIHSTLSKGSDVYSETYSKIEKNDYFRLLFEHSDLGNISKERQDQLFDSPGWTRIIVVSKNSAVSFQRFSLEEFTKAEELVFKRFGKVFEQAYTRFLDLKKAEEQARKSQIELSLERIRTQATSMQKSEDLLDIVVTMHAEFTSLGHEAQYFWHARWLEDTYEKAMTTGDGSRIGNVMELPRGFHQNEAINKWEENEESIGVITLDVDEAIDYVDRMIDEGRFDNIDHTTPGPEDIRALGGITFVTARTTHGEIGYSLPGIVEQPPADDLKTLVRFGGVFDLAYRRFKDLLKAEHQAYEAKVEASLERVRGMAAAMNHSDDLKQIAEEMFKEMEMLKINPLRYGLAMIDGPNKEAEIWASTVNNGLYLDLLGTISLAWHPMLVKAYDAWDAQHEELIYVLEGKELSDYYQKIGTVNPEIPDLEILVDPNNSETHYCCFFPFKSGTMYAFTAGEPDEDGKSILKRFSNVFEQAFARYEDLQKTEHQDRMIREERDRLDKALKELHATKDQLVQQEKLASLGQLTAGIAHEIKNPLNFVNNFSDLSIELVSEIRDELKLMSENNGSLEEVLDILSDIESNLGTILKHGSRADNIVKSMLEHSRGGNGIMEPTNLNNVVKEFVNLSFHGMRASKNPINVDLQFELDENIEEIDLIAEDFSRVIINISNNAFDAMREKSEKVKVKGEKYEPKLSIRTKQENRSTIIEIEDNGPGIPDEIKDKILQPFFTSKKGTEGTGLGLSITNDIIKAHGGNIVINSDDNGSVFSIHLPLNNEVI